LPKIIPKLEIIAENYSKAKKNLGVKFSRNP
jgi:hypothetical protein